MKSVELTIKGLEVEVEGSYSPATNDYFSKGMGCWYPGDPETLEDFAVYVVGNGHRIDITEALSEAERSDLENRFIDACNEESEPEYERDIE